MNVFGHTTGTVIACTTVALAIYTGVLYERHTAPRPCITNLSTTSYPMFEWEQIMLDTSTEYNKDSDFYRAGIKTSADLAWRLVEMSKDSDHPSSIYTNPRNGKEFYVPGLCRVGPIDAFGNPILYER